MVEHPLTISTLLINIWSNLIPDTKLYREADCRRKAPITFLFLLSNTCPPLMFRFVRLILACATSRSYCIRASRAKGYIWNRGIWTRIGGLSIKNISINYATKAGGGAMGSVLRVHGNVQKACPWACDFRNQFLEDHLPFKSSAGVSKSLQSLDQIRSANASREDCSMPSDWWS